ncbi:unnamed protein product [marine sediment metagenome]|uniref:Uncharacterized protein n=1 Tax=marine sediment metagenome TaxID=412755 RepID=X1CR51_9ZZZZ
MYIKETREGQFPTDAQRVCFNCKYLVKLGNDKPYTCPYEEISWCEGACERFAIIPKLEKYLLDQESHTLKKYCLIFHTLWHKISGHV